MKKKLISPSLINWMIGVSALILFGCSTLRHELFQSNAYDLGIFDQAVYLISQGQSPISSFLGFHILGDHAALIFYVLALFYKIYPSVYWLFAVQAVALANGALPTWHLARHAGLSLGQAIAVATVYLLYPLVFNINLFDFHPEVIAVPALLWAVLAARLERTAWFCLCIFLTLACKAVLSITVAAMGVWLLVFEKKRRCGAIALVSGICWFVIATKVVIPFFGTEAASVERHISRYAYLGNSFPDIAKNLLLNPGLVLGQIFSLDNLEYLLFLVAPVIWGLSVQGMQPLIAAVPTLGINLLSQFSTQKNLINQYSLPAVPFLVLAVISSLAIGQGWLRNKRKIVMWSIVAFLALAKYGYFWSIYLNSLDTWQATRQAVTLVQTKGSVLTTAQIAPHLTHRPVVKLTSAKSPPANLAEFDYILLNLSHPGWLSDREFATNLVESLKKTQLFELRYHQDGVHLFVKEVFRNGV
ncbi:hypothetical protein DP113_06845 [Brasilonema octagenarum UFV-E1]|uniref:DUF2079 domain-containing protein n=2 Tax=Brasilonema TaxID=383614 RepID=A0A856MF18_9CYAN|nr:MULTISPECIES: DUF2079 domain-containing protein [Brasilonema]NMF61922.1 hypothetical protein [Brasilonema octagenarum UFV-OR1]QDL07657.1 hypothetical protein DP114_06885 [Brasilonema sennae CENA114]QDL14019.1 hypothetical protein DP113_06845 [Brasilonema octagenarum UFV-E1]